MFMNFNNYKNICDAPVEKDHQPLAHTSTTCTI